MSNLFRSVKPIKAKRNKFDLSFENNLTTEFGRLTPILTQECIPGDVFRINTQILIRMAALFAPAFSRVNAYIHYLFVPRRLCSDDFETLITGGEDGEGTITNRAGQTRTAQQISLNVGMMFQYIKSQSDAIRLAKLVNCFRRGSLFDYLGFPTPDFDEAGNVSDAVSASWEPIDMSPFIAYALIYNNFYRDQNFQKEVDVCTDCYGDLFTCLMQVYNYSYQDAFDIVYNLLSIKIRNWEKDYFTSALPWPQRGDETTVGEDDTRIYPIDPSAHHEFSVDSANEIVDIDAQNVANMLKVSSSLVPSVNEYRRAIAIQKLKEAEARFGSRFFEYIRGFFGVKVEDARLQRPEFVGGSRIPIQFGEVLQTSQTDITPQGSYAGRGIGGGSTKNFKYKCKEHGWLIGILSIMPKPFYGQGWPKKFSRNDRFDFYNPLFAHLGEQEIKQKELAFFWNGRDGDEYDEEDIVAANNKLFGYTPRFAEMRYNPSEVHGEFRATLRDWHTARILIPTDDDEPSMLNSSFIEVDRESANRIFNYRGDSDHFWIDCFHSISAIRPMPKFGTPLL